MRWNQYQTHVSSAEFNQVLESLAALLSRPAGSFKEGVTDFLSEAGEESVVLCSDSKFIAARWHDGIQKELYFICPASTPPQLGYSELKTGAHGSIPTALSPWLSPQCRKEHRLPSFNTLLSAYAAKGATLNLGECRELELAADLDYLKKLVSEQSDLLRQARAELRTARLHKPNQAADAPEALDPETEVDLAQWCLEHEEDIVVLPRARNGAKKSRYMDPGLIVKSLEILAGPYRALRRGELSQTEFNERLQESGLKFSGSVAPSIAGEQGDAYFVSWAGRRRLLEYHLLKGGGRDERYCFRVYFLWDADSERAIVGSMPQHLSNSLS